MAINKVIYGNETLIDITDTTATDSTVLEGTVFYNAAGVRTVGSALAGISDVQTSDGTSVVSGGIATIPTEVFPVVYTIANSQEIDGQIYWPINKTFDECSAALLAGKQLLLYAYNPTSNEYTFAGNATHKTNTTIYFTCMQYVIGATTKRININWILINQNGARTDYRYTEDGVTYGKQQRFSWTLNNSLPTTTGTAGQILVGNGAGTLSWADMPAIPSTYTDVGAASASHTHADYATQSYVDTAVASISIPVQDVQDESGASLVSNGVATVNTPFIVTVTGTGTEASPYVADKTYNEIKEAHTNGRVCLAQHGNYIYQLYAVTTSLVRFIYIAYLSANLSENSTGAGTLTANLLTITNANVITFNKGAQYFGNISFPYRQGVQGQILVAGATSSGGNPQFLVWADMPAIPSTYTDVGAASAGHTHADYATQSYVDTAVASISVPSNVSAFTNDANYATQSYVDSAVASISAPAEVFVINMESRASSEGYSYTKDKTFAEIIAAYNAGKLCILIESIYPTAAATTPMYTEVYTNMRTVFLSNSPSSVYFTRPTFSEHSVSGTQIRIRSNEGIVKTEGSVMVMDTYNSESTQAMSGVAVASALNSLAIPSAVSELTNDSGYLTLADLPIYDGSVS